MKLFFSRTQLDHAPQQLMVSGRIVAPFEVPERAERMAAGLSRLGLTLTEPDDAGLTPLTTVHSDHYLDFLSSAHGRFQQLANAGPEVLPNAHPHVSATPDLAPRERPRPTGIIGQAGWYVGDMACAIGAGTWPAIYASAQAAVAAADAVLAGAHQAMALCRPPGHHAYHDRASGFCFVNNAAVAAQRLREKYKRVGILDFDTHHGDGTQAIFYRRSDVFYGSTHTSPRNYYPHFFGYADEAGFGEGDKFNLNVPLDEGADGEVFLAANRQLIVAALAAEVDALVISAGWDAHQDDPLSRLNVPTDAFSQLGRHYGDIPLPTVIVQEGGYSLTAIETLAPAFVSAFLNARKPAN